MSEFIVACKTTDIPADGKLSLEVDERFVVIAYIDGDYYCIDDVCTHDDGPLSDGVMGESTICTRPCSARRISDAMARRRGSVRGASRK